MLDTDCLLKYPLEKLSEENCSQSDSVARDTSVKLRSSMSRSYEDKTLNRGMIETPDRVKTAKYSPDINIITIKGRHWFGFVILSLLKFCNAKCITCFSQ